jgi:hypothetical protein
MVDDQKLTSPTKNLGELVFASLGIFGERQSRAFAESGDVLRPKRVLVLDITPKNLSFLIIRANIDLEDGREFHLYAAVVARMKMLQDIVLKGAGFNHTRRL